MNKETLPMNNRSSKKRKPNSTSRIAQMTTEQREQLMVWLFDKNYSYKRTIALCKSQFDVTIHTNSLIRFYRATAQKRNLARILQSANHAHRILEKLGNKSEEMYQALLSVVAQIVFDALTAAEAGEKLDLGPLMDALPLLIQARKDSRDDKRFSLEREQWEYDVVRACHDHMAELQAIVTSNTMDEPSRLQAIRRRLFGKNLAPEEQ